MSDFIVSARKYRPENFKSVVGQESIIKTLRNAIRNNHLGHAYLFCGPRGVGKTTCARIFAKTINCSDLTADTEPCNKCESCMAFNESRSYNIHELDAASNNSVDDIRSLTEQVRIPPQIGKYSVYIIDEVHMLSQTAFNAFLKTLEEPPAHAVFILATTEKHKIIPTILSRCQIFDFNRIKVDDAVKYLTYIAGNESVDYEDEALHVIAQKADGAMRDALSIFDQIVSFSGKTIKYQDVIENLNILDFEYYFRVTDSFLNEEMTESLLIFDQVLDKGFDGHNFITGLATHLRDLLVSTDQATVKLLEVSENLRQRYIEQSSKCNPRFLYEALDICNQTDINYKGSRNQRLLVELALVKLSNLLNEKKKPENSLEEKEIPEKTVLNPQKNEPAVSLKKQGSREKEIQPGPSEEDKSSASEMSSRNIIRGTGVSIKEAISGNSNIQEREIETDSEDIENIDETDRETEADDESFTDEELRICWNGYAKKLQEEKPRLYTTLISRNPVLTKDFEIEVGFDNTSQLEDFSQNIKHYLLSYLRRELKNTKIAIKSILNETDSGKRKLYTPEEKFQYLNKKNPLLGKLKQDFNLDFD